MYFKRYESVSHGVLATRPNRQRGWTLYFGSRTIGYDRRAGGPGTMGRFGGGWDIKLGVQAGSLRGLLTLRSVIVSLLFFSVSFGVQSEYRNEAKARAAPPPDLDPAKARDSSIADAQTLVDLAKDTRSN